jgi:hypothetical protein
MPLPHCAGSSGPNELRECHPPSPFPNKSSMVSSMAWRPRHGAGTSTPPERARDRLRTTKLHSEGARYPAHVVTGAVEPVEPVVACST